MEHRVVTYHSVRLVRVMALDVEHTTCGTFSSPSESVSLPTPVFIDSVVHASCDAGHSSPHHLSMSIGGDVHWVMTLCYSLPHNLSGFIRGVMREVCDACSHLHAKPLRDHLIGGRASTWGSREVRL